MFIDYLDPFWPVRTPEPPERTDEQQPEEDQRERDEVRDTPVRREERGYEDHGETIDEYA
ncbi:MAG: hypothetical protein EA427_10095 [Spirochaetaceae bacterium]|nr:MAG: hypothetical protein EA427_10095 [Spirochaetaceae bacterium]